MKLRFSRTRWRMRAKIGQRIRRQLFMIMNKFVQHREQVSDEGPWRRRKA